MEIDQISTQLINDMTEYVIKIIQDVKEMEPEASKAAIAAIAALQKRVRELEDELNLLEAERESINARIAHRDESYTIRERAFNEATVKAQQMLNSAAEAMIQVREARDESKRLKEQIVTARQLLQKQEIKSHSLRLNERKWRARFLQTNKLLSEYEALLPDVVARPHISLPLSPEEIALVCSAGENSVMLPNGFDQVLEDLRRAPKRFFTGSVETKINSARAIRRAWQGIRELHGQILDAEERKSGDEKKARKLSSLLVVMGNELDKFEFR
jgi:hypothetical protein